jgi:UDP-N-acetyl-D-glucosamine dehydrogenase
MAYKRDIDDLRESPSLTIIELLQKRGALVEYNDPFFPCVGRGRKYALNMTCTPLEKIPEFGCVVIVTDHTQYDYAEIVNKAKLVVDTRNVRIPVKWATDSGDVGQSRSEATLVVFLH